MKLAPHSLAELLPGAHPFDDIIDVRAPSEFAEDHLPGAYNLPVLDDTERARVGTIYTRESPFLARKIGAALVARNAATHLEGVLADRPGGWRPLVYCWRGGQRSNSFAAILAQIGWRVQVLEGGYKRYRRLVLDVLEAPPRSPVVVLDGNTGTAKTAIINRLAAHGAQAIDLEGLAKHRGSVFGAQGAQPPQKSFDSALAAALAVLDPARPVVIEAESIRIGALRLPGPLWRAMRQAPRITIAAPVPARAAFLAHAYSDITADTAQLRATIERLRPLHPAAQITEWQAMAAAGAHQDLAASLVVQHYDPAYARARARDQRGGDGEDENRQIDAPRATARHPDMTLATPSLTPEALDLLAARVAKVANGLASPPPTA